MPDELHEAARQIAAYCMTKSFCNRHCQSGTPPNRMAAPNGCADDTCKGLTESWMNEAVQAKKDCLQKKLG
jgi:hypothetical protein